MFDNLLEEIDTRAESEDFFAAISEVLNGYISEILLTAFCQLSELSTVSESRARISVEELENGFLREIAFEKTLEECFGDQEALQSLFLDDQDPAEHYVRMKEILETLETIGFLAVEKILKDAWKYVVMNTGLPVIYTRPEEMQEVIGITPLDCFDTVSDSINCYADSEVEDILREISEITAMPESRRYVSAEELGRQSFVYVPVSEILCGFFDGPDELTAVLKEYADGSVSGRTGEAINFIRSVKDTVVGTRILRAREFASTRTGIDIVLQSPNGFVL